MADTRAALNGGRLHLSLVKISAGFKESIWSSEATAILGADPPCSQQEASADAKRHGGNLASCPGPLARVGRVRPTEKPVRCEHEQLVDGFDTQLGPMNACKG